MKGKKAEFVLPTIYCQAIRSDILRGDLIEIEHQKMFFISIHGYSISLYTSIKHLGDEHLLFKVLKEVETERKM